MKANFGSHFDSYSENTYRVQIFRFFIIQLLQAKLRLCIISSLEQPSKIGE